MFRDGITPQLARAMCGWRMLFSRAAPLLLAAHAGNARATEARRDSGHLAGRSLHGNLLRFCRSSLPSRTRVEARHQKAARGWSGYMQERDHYSDDALAQKLRQVRAWIERTSPSWVLDLGANTGEFSFLAAQNGARVIALDADHDCIERLYLRARSQPELARAVHPVLAQLDDLCAGRGWSGQEAPGIVSRLAGYCDLVMVLGLVHHLMIACAIPVSEIAAFAARLTRGALILETVPESDPMVRMLAQHYDRAADAARSCGHAAQVEAFGRHFDIVEQAALPGSDRTLLLLTRKAS
jgi:SAM-dependent methyltransferase